MALVLEVNRTRFTSNVQLLADSEVLKIKMFYVCILTAGKSSFCLREGPDGVLAAALALPSVLE